MQAPKSLRRPSNWQDFETLCKKLWGEIWQCPEIKKNGRTGQAQHGVDVYGMPKGETAYFGIQCKGKDEYTDKQFTQDEVTKEIDKARSFKPELKKLYFATTAVKDAPIEQFVREKNIEHQQNGLFEVHLYCWEDIVDLIDENKQTSDWYITSQNYKMNYSAEFTFDNGETDSKAVPKFKQKMTIYRRERPAPAVSQSFTSHLDSILKMQSAMDRMIPKAFLVSTNYNSIKTNLSMIAVNLRLHNTGNEPLEDYKVYLTFEGAIQEISKKNATEKLAEMLTIAHYNPTTFVCNEDHTVTLKPRNSVLVHDDNFYPETFFIKPKPEAQTITIYYKLLSRNLKSENSLTIHVKPDIDVDYTVVTVETSKEERRVSGKVEDFIKLNDD